ncbi:MAG: hypothetical protein K9L74_03605 [Candidatus Izimaplasma sp.]|nr:hypothetical protein [Candidatus Izimaplasma bacterium]
MMVKLWFKQFIQIAVIIVLYAVLARYINDIVLISILIAIIIGSFVFNFYRKRSSEWYLEARMNPKKYLEILEKSKKEKDLNKYYLRKAYGLIYNNDTQEAKNTFNLYQKDELLEKENYFLMYIRIKTLIAFEEEDVDKLREIKTEVESSNYNAEEKVKYPEVYIMLLENEYPNAKELLFEIIPKQKAPVHIVELEYYLAYVYDKLEKEEDKKAVAEFITKKNYPIFYTELANKFLE